MRVGDVREVPACNLSICGPDSQQPGERVSSPRQVQRGGGAPQARVGNQREGSRREPRSEERRVGKESRRIWWPGQAQRRGETVKAHVGEQRADTRGKTTQ